MYDLVAMCRTFRALQHLSGVSLVATFTALSTLVPLSAFAQGVTDGSPARGAAGLRMDTLQRVGDAYFVATADGGRAELTLDPGMQEATDEVLRTFQIPYAGAVVLSIAD